MAGNSPRLRPLTLAERQVAWVYGLAPTGLVYVLLVGLTYLLTRPDVDLFTYYIRFADTEVSVGGLDVPVDFHMILARLFYVVAYFTWGRSTGHLAVGAHIVDRKTGRRMNAWQKLARGLVQVAGGSTYIILDAISFLLILLDREERRSVYDWIVGTLVVVGDLPPEPEAAYRRSWIGELGRVLRGRSPAPHTLIPSAALRAGANLPPCRPPCLDVSPPS